MLWTLSKVVIFLSLVLAAAFGVEYLIDSSDNVQIVLLGTKYTLSPLMAVLALVLLLFGTWIVFKLAGLLVAVLRFINGDETAMSRYFDRNRERKGYNALTDGMMALASGENDTAISKAKAAERYLGKPEVTTLLTAQAAEAAGDTKTAEGAYKALLANDNTRFVGVRGLMKQKLEAGDTKTALRLAEKAFALKPRHGETQDTLLQLQASDEDWAGARETLTAKMKSGALPRDVHKRRSAVLSIAQSRDALAEGQTEAARSSALEANRLSPDLVPGAVLAARMHVDGNAPGKAASILKAAWKKNPHPDLAAAFADIKPDEDANDRVKRFKALINQAPKHAESRMLATELHLAAEDYDKAREALGDLTETDPSTRAFTLLAVIERAEGADDTVVRACLARAASASRGPSWVCDNCGTVHGTWGPICEECEGFDTLAWKEPKGAADDTPAARTEMLPLIVGQLEDKTEDAEDIPEAEEPTPEVAEAGQK